MANSIVWKILKQITRKKISVDFKDPLRTKPVSSLLGCDRGTPIDRHYIEHFLQSRAHLITGRVLEVGDGTYSRMFGGAHGSAFDVLHATAGNRNATIIGDLTDASTLPAEAFDCFICTQTFNFIFEVQQAVFGAHYLLKPGGVLLATVSGISQISRYDMERWGDYWRFTNASMKKLFEPVFTGGVEITSFGNVLAACAFLQGVVVEDLPNKALLDEHDPDYQLLLTIVARK